MVIFDTPMWQFNPMTHSTAACNILQDRILRGDSAAQPELICLLTFCPIYFCFTNPNSQLEGHMP